VSDEESAEDKPRPTKKRKKKRAPAPETPRTEEATKRERPEEWPSFASDFPSDEELDRLVNAFAGGNYALVRREAPLLAKRTESDDVRRAARELRKRVDPDPTSVYLLAVASVLLAFLAYWYWSHPHGS
jgi:hypothetical protein